MKKLLLSAVFLLSFFVLRAQQKDEGNVVKVGDMVPDFKVQMFDGKEVDIVNLRGKVVLVNFWATWCPSCIQELAVVQKEIIDKFKDKEFIFLPISREDPYEKIAAFRKDREHNFPMGMDPNRKIYSKFATVTIPRNYVINKDGKIVYMEKGYTKELLNEMVREIEKLLQ